MQRRLWLLRPECSLQHRSQSRAINGERCRSASKAREAKAAGAGRFCMGAAWKGVKEGEAKFESVLNIVRDVKQLGMEVCVTLGQLTDEAARQLKEAGSPPTITISTLRPNTIATLSPRTRSKIGSAPFALCKRRNGRLLRGDSRNGRNRRTIDSRCSRFFVVLILPQKVFRSTASCRRREPPSPDKSRSMSSSWFA